MNPDELDRQVRLLAQREAAAATARQRRQAGNWNEHAIQAAHERELSLIAIRETVHESYRAAALNTRLRKLGIRPRQPHVSVTIRELDRLRLVPPLDE